jgi:purine-binding chemotaxis protein CheW
MAELQYASFFIKDFLFGINVVLVREIITNAQITQVDLSKDYICGLMNLRGQIVTIIDPSIKIGIGGTNTSAKTKYIILKTSKELQSKGADNNIIQQSVEDIVGIKIDDIGDIITIDSKEIELPPANITEVDSKYIVGVVKLKEKLFLLLNIKNVLNTD